MYFFAIKEEKILNSSKQIFLMSKISELNWISPLTRIHFHILCCILNNHIIMAGGINVDVEFL